MIYGITGLPGNGKTLYALWWVKQKSEQEGRTVWYHGINGLTLPWHRLTTETQTVNGVEIEVPQWWLAPTGSIVIIDEAQNCGFGVRGRGQTPDWARKLETHRHLGIDLVFITQSPMLLDSHDRALVGTHFHVVRNFGLQRSTVHEFQQLKDNVVKSRNGSIRHEWKFPREVYTWYKSAELHTYKARIPMRVWLLLVLPVLVGLVLWYIVHRWQAKTGVIPEPVAAAASAPPSVSQLRPTAPANGVGTARPVLTRAEYLEQFVPRVAALAYTAPVYDEVTKPVEAPYPAACVASSKRCQCYTQQATRLETPEELCRSVAAGGFFVAWVKPGGQTLGQGKRLEEPAPISQPVSFGGDPRAHILARSATQALPAAR
jgi:zona occludens toxin (predicted ATPase)